MSPEALLPPPYTERSSNDDDEHAKRLALRRRKASASPWMAIAKEEFESTPRSMFNTTSSGPIFIRFRSPAAHRLQLRAQSCSIWFPQETAAGLDTAFSFMTTSAPSCPSLAVALDASSLIHLGQEDGDSRLLVAGQKLYCEALNLLRCELQSPSNRRPDALVGAICVLQIIEAFTSMTFEGTNWRLHTQGLDGLLQSLETKSMEERLPGFSQLIDVNFRLFHLWDALVARKGINQFYLGDGTVISKVAAKVPGALEDCDDVCHTVSKLTLDRAVHIMSALRDLEDELSMWSKNWTRCIRDLPYQLVSSTEFPFPELSTTVPSKAFPLVFQFNSLSYTLDHAIFSACLFSVKRAMLDLSSALSPQPEAVKIAVCGDSNKLRASVTNCADNLCMGLPYLCDSRHGKYGLVCGTGPLYLANSWYRHLRKHGNERVSEKVLWCHEATKRLRRGGIRPLSTLGSSSSSGVHLLRPQPLRPP